MFHVECLIDDKDVVKLHYQLAVLKVYNLEIKPVINAKKAKGAVVEAVPGGRMTDRLILAVPERFTAGGDFSSADINALVREMGGTPTAKYISGLIKAKVIKRAGRGHFKLAAKRS
jgi:hypothetical protein